MDCNTFFALALPLYCALAMLAGVIGLAYALFRLLEWAYVSARFRRWKRKHGR